MSEDVGLFSSRPLTKEELGEVILEVGGVMTPDQQSFGRVSQGQRHIWVYEDDVSKLEELASEDQEARELLELITIRLGDKPRSSFSLDISRTPGSGILAVDLAYRCAQHWPCVVAAEIYVGKEIHQKVFSREDMRQLLEEGKGFIMYGMEPLEKISDQPDNKRAMSWRETFLSTSPHVNSSLQDSFLFQTEEGNNMQELLRQLFEVRDHIEHLHEERQPVPPPLKKLAQELSVKAAEGMRLFHLQVLEASTAYDKHPTEENAIRRERLAQEYEACQQFVLVHAKQRTLLRGDATSL